ncbi:hypothetical protein FRACYDRAFT_246785 [Fragilariopsis cylindrus CCMP1102]|uniref:G-protein coupled receptors family 2 profile 2 domain-containing protein n=1 Tax=Fragilariopsis cylindrus CCMP1102 TaxID=635003 RepID=A0A1E7EY11_9STRA|nr:hypothetical protein FRACYDRAFT_246785 [Fragilariopsis cylindrus CCMP1102]|eukprot:OEU10910.1 hypothetical protein FRACYDRAFT_246785 [Fragilariopsis cylindrus CCMP1102]
MRDLLEDDQQQVDVDEEIHSLSSRQLKTNEWVPRIAGVISVISALCMLIMAWKRRDRLFHRLILGMSIHLLIQGGFLIYGTAAIPRSASDEAYGASGNIITCTIQGFFLYTCLTTSVFYYCSLSVYSYVNVMNNHDKTKYLWIEKYIHAIVHIYPISTALYILSTEGFNNAGYGYCGIASAPLGCEEFEDSIECERGPITNYNLRTLQWIGIAPDILVIIFPTVVMIILYWTVKQRQSGISILAQAVAFQSGIYLAVIYVATIPFLVGKVIELIANGKLAYTFTMFAVFTFSLFGFFTLLVYVYFSLPHEREDTSDHAGHKSNTTTYPRMDSTIKMSSSLAQFVVEGDSDDERTDNEETLHWSSVQNYC